MSTTHTHLDRARRTRGECPACDLRWEDQDERLSKTGPRERAEREIANLVNREVKLVEERYGG